MKLNTLQISALIFVQIAATSLLIIPGSVVEVSGMDGWMSLIISTVQSLGLGMIVYYFYKNYPKDTLIGIFDKVAGKYLGKILGIGFIFYCLISLSTVIKQGCSITGHIFLPETKPATFFIVFFLIVVYIVKMGLVVLARTNILVMIFLIISFIIILITAIPLLEIPLTPVLAKGITPVLKGSLSPASFMNQVILIVMIFPLFPKQENGNIKKVILNTLILVGVLNTLLTVMTLGILGQETKDQYFPVYTVAKLIEIDILWRRLDVLIMFSWVAGVTLKMSFWFYCAVVAIKEICKLENYSPIVFPTALLTFLLGYFATNNSTELAYYLGKVYPLFALFTYELLIPVILCIVILLKKVVSVR